MTELSTELIGYRFVQALPLPTYTSSRLEYLVGSNGIFARAVRPGLEVLLPVAHTQSLKGLATLTPFVTVTPKVPEALLIEMWRRSCQACADPAHPLEILFHLLWVEREWQLIVPEQEQSAAHCCPLHTDSTSSATQAVIEVHSHHQMPAYFSSTDDADECHGFRIYGVFGKVRSVRPEMQFRVGLFGHFWQIPATSIFELSGDSFVEDVSNRREV
ncbi:MAG: Mov34/MPN/PAD-1 family protein [Leptolyngbyaceae cyanobacterium bins.302]|nr:Mov34/MPN/PAD-1 family protein [Leptolyngbyaceae cyanobacterium bins.302]